MHIGNLLIFLNPVSLGCALKALKKPGITTFRGKILKKLQNGAFCTKKKIRHTRNISITYQASFINQLTLIP